MNDDPAFEVRVGDKHYKIWRSGRTEGFSQGDAPVLVVNRIPRLVLSYQAKLDRG
jgi:hypothetical protein